MVAWGHIVRRKQCNYRIKVIRYVLRAKLSLSPLCFVIGRHDQYALFAISPSLHTCAPSFIFEQERIPKPHARQPQHQRRRTGKEQQEGYVVEITVLDRSPIDEDVHTQFLEQLPDDYIEVRRIGACLMIQEGSLPVRLYQSIPAMIAMALE